MAAAKRTSPYVELKERFRTFVRAFDNRRIRSMWTFPRKELPKGWDLSLLYERVAAANQIGFDVCLYATEAGIEVKYVERVSSPYV